MLRMLLAPNPSPMTLDGTRTFVVGAERPAVIDPGPDDEAHVGAILAALDERAPAAILLTHGHPDHSGAARALAARTGAPVRMRDGALARALFEALVDGWLADDERVATDAGVLHAVATPGHAPEHACFLWTGGPAGHERTLFAGDLFMGGADTALVAPPEGDLTEYLASLDRVEAIRPAVILPAHGPPIEDPAAAVGRYRAHRETRIAQVVRALRQEGPARARELVPRVYGAELAPALVPAAEGSLRAILAHLAAAGAVRAGAGGRHELVESRSE